MLKTIRSALNLDAIAPCVLLLITWLPMKGGAQVLAFVLLAAGVLLLWGLGHLKIIWRDALFLGGFFLFYALYALTYTDTGVLNPLVGLLTYSGFLIFAMRAKSFQPTAKIFVLFVAVLSLGEGVLGVLQVIIAQRGHFIFQGASAGDFAVGTTFVETNSHIYAAKMFYQALFLLYSWIYSRSNPLLTRNERRLVVSGLVTGMVGAIYASPLAFMLIHFMIVLACHCAILAWHAVHHKPRVWGEIGILVVWVLASLLVVQLTQPDNSILIRSAAGQVDAQPIPVTQKLDVFLEVGEHDLLASGKTAVLGYGLGRHSSRAAVILSGDYLQNHPDWLPISTSPQTEKLIKEKWNDEVKDQHFSSHLAMPSSSFQGIVLEFGLLGVAALGGYLALLFMTMGRWAKQTTDDFQAFLLTRMPIFLLGLGGSCLFFFWAEYPPVIAFIGMLFMIVLAPLEKTS